MTKNDNFSFSFYKTLLEKIKCKKDKRRPEDEPTNKVERGYLRCFVLALKN